MNMNEKKKVVFKDADKVKVAFGYVTFENGFVVVTDDAGKQIQINKDCVTVIKDGDYWWTAFLISILLREMLKHD